MPHMDENIICRHCGEFYCAVCKENCPKCGIEDIVGAERKKLREKRRNLMNNNKNL